MPTLHSNILARVKLIKREEVSSELQKSADKSPERFEMSLNIFIAWGQVPCLAVPMPEFILNILPDGFVD